MKMANLQNQLQKNDWETLRKQARQAENEIESKLVSFSKLCSTYTLPKDMGSDTKLSNSDTLFETLTIEIDQLLKKLTQINNKMSDSIGVSDTIIDTSNASVHTLQRHRDILRDYSQEFEKTKRNIMQFREREKLFSMNSNNLSNASSGGLNNRRYENNNSTTLYLKESDHLKNSHLMIDQQLEAAEMTKENLLTQKQRLKAIQTRINTLANKFPLINSVLQRVKFKKRKDSIILAIVISICIIIFLLFLF